MYRVRSRVSAGDLGRVSGVADGWAPEWDGDLPFHGRGRFTDVDGSAALREASPDLMAAVLARHDRTIEEAARAHGGELIRAPAHRPDEPWPTPRPIAIQTGIHTGEAELRDGQYIGPVVERCARLCSIGHGDQILLSEVAAGLLRTIRRPAPACDS